MEQNDLANRFILTPNPIVLTGQKNVECDLRPGESLYSFLTRHVPNLDGNKWVATIGGREVPRELWTNVFPKHGQIIELRGDVAGRSVLMIVAMVALTFVTFGIGAYGGYVAAAAGGVGTVGGTLAATAVYMAGAMIINKVLGPKPPKARDSDDGTLYSLTGSNNRMRPNEPFGLLFGKVQIAPDIISAPYGYFQGDDQYMGMILTPGFNVDRVDEIYNGETPLSSFRNVKVYHNNFSGIPSVDIPLATNVQEVPGGDLTPEDKGQAGPVIARTTVSNTMRAIVNLTYRLGDKTTKGKDKQNQETVRIKYRLAGSTNWTINDRSISNSDEKEHRRAYVFDLPVGTYDFEVQTLGNSTDGKGAFFNMTLNSIACYRPDETDYSYIPRIGIDMMADGQLSGAPNELRMIAYSKPCEVWNGTTWETKHTSNAAAHILRYIRGIYADDNVTLLAGMAIPDSDIDIEAFKAFMLHCEAEGFTYDYWITNPRSHEDVIQSIAMVAMGQVTVARGRFTPIWCNEFQPFGGAVNMATVTQGSFQVDYTLANAADGIEYTYTDSTDWLPKTLRVQDPTNANDPVNPATLQGEGVTRADHAGKLARFHMAQSLFQYKDIGYTTGAEYLSYGRFTKLQLQHDLTQWGFGGRVVSATKSGNNVILELDEPVPGVVNAFIGVRALNERTVRTFKVQSFSGNSSTVTLIPTGSGEVWPSDMPFPGDYAEAPNFIWMYDFKSTVGYPVRVVGIDPNGDTASVSVVWEGPEYWEYVNRGGYQQPTNASSLDVKPTAFGLKVSDYQVVQGNTTFTELDIRWDVSGASSYSRVYIAGEDGVLRQIGGDTITRSITTRVDLDQVYSIVVTPYSMGFLPGNSVKVDYQPVTIGGKPVLVDYFDVTQESGGIRKYTWGFAGDTIQSPDFAGVEVRHVTGTVSSPDWDTMLPIGDTGFYTSGFEAVIPESGTWTFACRSRNSSGDLSTAMRIVTRTLSENLGEQIGGIGQDIDTITADQVAQQQAIDQEILDRVQGDLQTAQEAAADATAKANAARDAAIAHADVIGAQVADILEADEWAASKTYPTGDLVQRIGKLYRARRENTNMPPESSLDDWEFIGNYASLGEAVAASIGMGTQNASDIQTTSTQLNAVVARMPSGTDKLANEARVVSAEQAAATANDATAGRVGIVEARMPAGNGELATAGALNALSSTVTQQGDTLTSQGDAITLLNNSVAGKADASAVNALSTRVDNVEGVNQSQADAITAVTSTANAAANARPNAMTNPYFSPMWSSEGAPGAWTVGVWGRVGGVAAVSQGNKAGGYAYIDSERISVTPNTSYVASGDMMNLNNTLWGRVLIIWFNGETPIGSEWGTPIAGPFDFHVDSEFGFRKTMAVAGVSPANATHAMLRFNWDFDSNAGSYRVIGVRRPKFENGATPTPFSDDASGFNNATAVVELKSRTTALEASASVTTAVLASLGGSGNLFENSDFARVTGSTPNGWGWAWNPGGWTGPYVGIGGSNWEPSGGASIGGTRSAAPSASNYAVIYGPPAQAVPGKRYIISGFTANHRCTTRLALLFKDRNGTQLAEPGSDWSTVFGQGGTDITAWEYRWFSYVAPAGAATVTGGVWATGTGDGNTGANPLFWFTRPMLEEASEYQTKPSPWSPGSNSKQTASAVSTLTADVSTVTGKVNARHTVALDVNGNVSGTVSENDGTRSSFSVLADVFRVISSGLTGFEIQGGYQRNYSAGAQMVMGHNFGSGDLIFWYGPNVGAANCTKANATIWFDKSGNAYFGGSLAAGVLKNAAQTTVLTANPTITVGPFSTNGKTKVVTVGFSASSPTYTQYYPGRPESAGPPPPPETSQGPKNVTLRRSYAGGASTQVASVPVSHGASVTREVYIPADAFNPNLPGGGWEQDYNLTSGASLTYSDTLVGTGTFTYEAYAGSPTYTISRQSLSVTSVEQP